MLLPVAGQTEQHLMKKYPGVTARGRGLAKQHVDKRKQETLNN